MLCVPIVIKSLVISITHKIAKYGKTVLKYQAVRVSESF